MSGEQVGQDRSTLLELGVAVSAEPILLVDDQTRILMASQGAGRLLGWQREDLVGHLLSQFIFPPPDVAQLQLQGHQPGERPLEFELQRRDGSLVPVEAHCTVFADDQGQNHCVLIIHDITRHQHYDEERTARLAKLSLINQVSEALQSTDMPLDQILEAVLICITAGQGLRFNRAFLLLIDEQEMVLRGEIAIGPSNRGEASRIWNELEVKELSLFEMVTRYDRSVRQTDVAVNEIVKLMRVDLDEIDHILIRSMRDRRSFCIVTEETRFEGVEDLRRWLGSTAFAVAPLVTRRGPVGVVLADNAISGQEITDLDLEFLQLFADKSANAIENSRLYHELERRLLDLRKAAQRQKEDQDLMLRMERLSVMGETSAIVAHELRNPLVAIGGFARTLSRSLADDDPNKQFADIITEEVVRLEGIIHDLLDFIRPQKLLRKSVIADDLVAETAQRYAPEMADQGVQLEIDQQAPGVVIQVNPGEIQQVLQNLFMNAMQAMPDGGTVSLRTRLLVGGFQVVVSDEGPGFAADLNEQIFAPFFTTKATGSGLGLTICSRIVKAHGGTIETGNRPRGGGRVIVVLPLPKPQEEDVDKG